MGIETERKFLVTGEQWRKLGTPVAYAQGYLSNKPERTVRVRIAGGKAFLTIKGKTTGFSRPEFEYEIPVEDAKAMLNLCPNPPVEKFRTVIKWHEKVWEVDEFTGSNQGLIMAEIELQSEDEHFDKPEWIGEEVTENRKYYNGYLSEHPFGEW